MFQSFGHGYVYYILFLVNCLYICGDLVCCLFVVVGFGVLCVCVFFFFFNTCLTSVLFSAIEHF